MKVCRADLAHLAGAKRLRTHTQTHTHKDTYTHRHTHTHTFLVVTRLHCYSERKQRNQMRLATSASSGSSKQSVSCGSPVRAWAASTQCPGSSAGFLEKVPRRTSDSDNSPAFTINVGWPSQNSQLRSVRCKPDEGAAQLVYSERKSVSKVERESGDRLK